MINSIINLVKFSVIFSYISQILYMFCFHFLSIIWGYSKYISVSGFYFNSVMVRGHILSDFISFNLLWFVFIFRILSMFVASHALEKEAYSVFVGWCVT